MQIRRATLDDAEQINNVHLQAFEKSEAERVAKLAVGLLSENSDPETLSLVAIEDALIIGHIAFSPVYLASSKGFIATILAPLAVLPDYQKNKVGSSLIKFGLKLISNSDESLVLVYGDPNYYSKFGFNIELAKPFMPPYKLAYPEGWLALSLNDNALPVGGKISCVSSLNYPDLW